eukprot:2733119-Prymnesium_polylepis.1
MRTHPYNQRLEGGLALGMCGKYVVCSARLGLASFSSSTLRSEKMAFYRCPEVVQSERDAKRTDT